MIDCTPSHNPESAPPQTLLVVEDEVLTRLAISDALRDAGYHVLEAASGDEAKTLLASFKDIAVVFTDVQMPGATDGAALALFVRESYPHLPVIVTSGTKVPATVESVTFVAKPYDPADIARRIKRLLE